MINRPHNPQKSFLDSFCLNQSQLLIFNPNYMNIQSMIEAKKKFLDDTSFQFRHMFLFYLTPDEFVSLFKDKPRFEDLKIESLAIEGLPSLAVRHIFTNLPAGIKTIAIENLEYNDISFIYAQMQTLNSRAQVICGPTISIRFKEMFTLLNAGVVPPQSVKRRTPVKKKLAPESSDSDSASASSVSSATSSAESDAEPVTKKAKTTKSSSAVIIGELEEKLTSAKAKGYRLERAQTQKNKTIAESQRTIEQLNSILADKETSLLAATNEITRLQAELNESKLEYSKLKEAIEKQSPQAKKVQAAPLQITNPHVNVAAEVKPDFANAYYANAYAPPQARYVPAQYPRNNLGTFVSEPTGRRYDAAEQLEKTYESSLPYNFQYRRG